MEQIQAPEKERILSDVKFERLPLNMNRFYLGQNRFYKMSPIIFNLKNQQKELQSISYSKPTSQQIILTKNRYQKSEEIGTEPNMIPFKLLDLNTKEASFSASKLFTKSIKRRVKSEFLSQLDSNFDAQLNESVKKQQKQNKELLIPYLKQLKQNDPVAYFEKSISGLSQIKKRRNISEYRCNSVLEHIKERNIALYAQLDETTKRKKIELQKILSKLNYIIDLVDLVQYGNENISNIARQLYDKETFIDLHILLKNLPQNLQKLKEYYGNEKTSTAILRKIQKISPKLLNYLFVQEENQIKQQKLKNLNLASQFFHLLVWNTEIIEKKEIFEFKYPIPEWILNTYSFLEMILLKNCDAKSLFRLQIRKNKSKNSLKMENNQVQLRLSLEFITELYCFNQTLENTLDDKTIQIGTSKKQISEDNINKLIDQLGPSNRHHLQAYQILGRPKLQGTDLDKQIEGFERKFGKLNQLSFVERQASKLISLKIQKQ